MTPELWSILGLAITTLGSILVALINARGWTREALVATTLIKGVEAGVEKARAGDAPADVVKTEIKALATNQGVQDYLHARVQELFPTDSNS